MKWYLYLLLIFSLVTMLFGVINLDLSFILIGVIGLGIGVMITREMKQEKNEN